MDFSTGQYLLETVASTHLGKKNPNFTSLSRTNYVMIHRKLAQ